MASLNGTLPFPSAYRYMKILKYTMTGSSWEFYGTGTNFFRYRYRYFFPGPNFSGTGTGTFFPGLIFSGTGTGTFFRDNFFPVSVPVPSKKRENSRDRDKTGTIWDFFKRLRY